MRFRLFSATTALVLTLALLAGCSDDGSERQRVVCEVEAVNAGSPLVAAYIVDGGDGIIGGAEPDDVYPADAVTIEFRARPYSMSTMTIPQNDAYSSFIITGYNLTWQLGADAPAGLDLTPYNLTNAPFYLQVPINDEAQSAVLVANRDLKEAVLVAQGGGGWPFSQDFNAYAHLEFIGHASGDKNTTLVPAGVVVNFTYLVSKD